MLHRSPASDRKRNAKRERRRLAQQRYRARFDAGKFTVTVEIDGAVVEMLVSTGWLIEGKIQVDNINLKTKGGTSDDRKKIGMAIAAMLSEAAKR
jgi:hypothetical protein